MSSHSRKLFCGRHKQRLVKNLTDNEWQFLNSSASYQLDLRDCCNFNRCSEGNVKCTCETAAQRQTELTPPQILIDKLKTSENCVVDELASSDSENVTDNADNPVDDTEIQIHSLQAKLGDWAVRYQINQNAVSALLLILRNYGHSDLPRDCRTLVKTPRKKIISQMDNGSYCHFGLKPALITIISERRKKGLDLSLLNLLVNIDGLPVSKSANNSLWPILCSDTLIQKVYMIGAFFGKQKPKDPNEYLQTFINELLPFVEGGFVLDTGENVMIRLFALICDAPAKAFALCVKGHSGYNSCSKCTIEGEFFETNVCFPTENNIRLRSDNEFLEGIYEDYQLGESILCKIPHFGPVSSVPLDYMHLVCLGVTRKLLLLWIKGPLTVRLSGRKIEEISNLLGQLGTSCPNEFVRKPRSLLE